MISKQIGASRNMTLREARNWARDKGSSNVTRMTPIIKIVLFGSLSDRLWLLEYSRSSWSTHMSLSCQTSSNDSLVLFWVDEVLRVFTRAVRIKCSKNFCAHCHAQYRDITLKIGGSLVDYQCLVFIDNKIQITFLIKKFHSDVISIPFVFISTW